MDLEEQKLQSEAVIVGVDFGMTFTGVAFSTLDDLDEDKEPFAINRWPGTSEQANKMPTAVGYRAGNAGIKSWGFGCPSPQNTGRGMAVKDRFKVYLDPAFHNAVFGDDPESAPGTVDDVRMWYRDFLTALYDYVVRYLEDYYGDFWNESRVEYIFSVPTTWYDHAIVEDFRELAKKAGFGSRPKDSMAVGLTEAEAAAVYTTESATHRRLVSSSEMDANAGAMPLATGNTLLICDSGGATTDICVLKVMSVKKVDKVEGDDSQITELKQLDFVDGEAIGSVQIDEEFETEVNRRLDLIRSVVDLPEYAAQEMVRGKFQQVKSTFGTPLGMIDYSLEVPKLPKDFSNSGARIVNGRMMFTQKEIAKLFDSQIKRVLQVVQKQLGRLKVINPIEQVSHFILSGGLCSSSYVQQRILSEYGKGIDILVSKCPELAVCKGLVIDRLYQLRYGNSVLSTRCCRASYGILFSEPYDRRKHGKQKLLKPLRNPIDGQKYAVDQICWLIRQGQPINRNKPISRTFYRAIAVNDPDLTWEDTIAMSRTAPDRLPAAIHEGDATVVCKISSKLKSPPSPNGTRAAEIKRRRELRFWKFDEYLRIEHEVVVTVGPADLRFEIRFEGEPVSDEKAVPTKWMYIQDCGEQAVDEEADGNNYFWHRSLIAAG